MMWLASPSAEAYDSLMTIDREGRISYGSYYSYSEGIRPIVCLKSDVQLEKQSDGTYQIAHEPVSSSDIAKLPQSYYGIEVKGYEAPHEGVNKWRIFYADENNVYLIADDSITGENAPNGQKETAITQNNSKYELSFNNVYKDYSGASWISENSKGAKWLSQFLGSYGTSTDINIRSVAYMMDTNVWSGYYAEPDAEYAMGGPTLEMFCESYKDTHPSRYLECGNVNSNGYDVRFNGDSWGFSAYGLIENDFNSIYNMPDYSKNYGVWLASPSSGSDRYLMNATDASVSYSVYDYFYADSTTIDLGLRPIVCLKSSIQFKIEEDGYLWIQ